MSSITLIGAVKIPYTGGGKTLYRREYSGLKKDFDMLPTDDDLASGSICRFPETGEYAEYFAGTKTWYLHKLSASTGDSGTGGSTTPDDADTATDEEVSDMFDDVFSGNGEDGGSSGSVPGTNPGDENTASDKDVSDMFDDVFNDEP